MLILVVIILYSDFFKNKFQIRNIFKWMCSLFMGFLVTQW